MTKDEAIALMKQGGKVRHRYFSLDEWVMMDGTTMIFEDGVRTSEEDFWSLRQGLEWLDDWYLF